VLAEVAGRWSSAEIGERLHISAATARTHVRRLLTKLDAQDQLVMIAYETASSPRLIHSQGDVRWPDLGIAVSCVIHRSVQSPGQCAKG
jgi:Bacterial regulatory proteins, luxR family